MQKYFLNDGSGQQGPFSLEELKDKNLTPASPIWYDGLPNWTTAGELPELKDLLAVHMPPPFEGVKPVTETPKTEEPVVVNTPVVEAPVTKVEEPVVTVTTTPVVEMAAAVPTPAAPATSTPIPAAKAPAGKKSTAWISWALGVLLLGGTGYYIYQDMEKNKDNAGPVVNTMATTDTVTVAPPTTDNGTMNTATTNTADTAATPATDATVTNPPVDATTATETNPATTPTTATTPAIKPGMTDKEKAAAKAKADADAKKKADDLKKKAADDAKKKQDAANAAAAAQAAKEAMMRNNWPKYITIGQLNYVANDGVKPFDVPVYNGTSATIDKVTLRVDYMKREKKLFKSETLTVYNIPPGQGVNAHAPESKKGDKVNVYITSISSKKLHFCYPQNNGNAADPYFCQ